ncbi:MAG: ATP-binding cassette domain-containing protein [Acidobacteria bacterium]|nr:ATP-binding cassette domain-containing protein [Acidobacteriota bacterium]
MSEHTAPEEGTGLGHAWPLIKRFWKWVRPHQRYAWVVAALLVLSSPLSLVSPLIVRRVVDDAVLRSDPGEVVLWGGVLIGMTIVAIFLGLGVGYATTLLHTKVLRDVRVDLYLHMQGLSLGYYHDKETGWLMSRQTDDVDSLDAVMADAFARALIDGIKGIGFAVMIVYIEWRMAVGGLLLAAMIFGFQYLISGRMRRLSKTARERWTAVSSTLHQSLSGHALVIGTASERRESLRFLSVLHHSVRAAVRRDMFSLITDHVFGLIGGVAPTIIVLGGVWLIVTSDFTVGGLFAFFMYLTSLFGAVASIVGLNPRLQRSLASLERIYEVLDTEAEVVADGTVRPAALTGSVRFDHLGFEYVPGQPVLHNISLEVAPRQTVALVGPSGAGKSTLASLLGRFYDPTAGQILVDGHDLRGLDLRWYRSRVGLVPQEIFLFDRSVADNIAYGARGATRATIEEAAAAANATEFITAMPDGFDTVIGERGVKLSGGQRQRLAIARELLRDPAILILDEATSSLDSRTETLIQEALGTLLAERTSIVIAHRLSTIIGADLIVVLEDGRVVERGTHDLLLGSGDLYAQLYRSQFREIAAPTKGSGR